MQFYRDTGGYWEVDRDLETTISYNQAIID